MAGIIVGVDATCNLQKSGFCPASRPPRERPPRSSARASAGATDRPPKPDAAFLASMTLLLLLVLYLLRGPQFWPIVRLIMGTLFPALWIWLTVRTINRRGRWAKRKAAALLIGFVLSYLFSFVIY